MAKKASRFKIIGLLCLTLCSICAVYRFAHPSPAHSPCTPIKALIPSSPSASPILATKTQITSPRHDNEHDSGLLKNFTSYYTTQNIVLLIAGFAILFGVLIILKQYREKRHEAVDKLNSNRVSTATYKKNKRKKNKHEPTLTPVTEADEEAEEDQWHTFTSVSEHNHESILTPVIEEDEEEEDQWHTFTSVSERTEVRPILLSASSAMPNMAPNTQAYERLCPGLLFGQHEDQPSNYNCPAIEHQPHINNVNQGSDTDSDPDNRLPLGFTGCRYK